MSQSSLFNIIGPVIIGPSSSHTAGAVKLGLLARKIFFDKPNEVKFILYNSYAKTGKGHGTDKGLLAGVLGFDVDNENIKNAFELAKKEGIKFSFENRNDFSRHPNSVDIVFEKPFKLVVKGDSVGGGNIVVTDINDYKVELRGDYYTLLIVYKDKPGMVYNATNIIKQENVNIASLICNRTQKGEEASMCISLDSPLPEEAFEKLKKIEEVFLLRHIEAL